MEGFAPIREGGLLNLSGGHQNPGEDTADACPVPTSASLHPTGSNSAESSAPWPSQSSYQTKSLKQGAPQTLATPCRLAARMHTFPRLLEDQ